MTDSPNYWLGCFLHVARSSKLELVEQPHISREAQPAACSSDVRQQPDMSKLQLARTRAGEDDRTLPAVAAAETWARPNAVQLPLAASGAITAPFQSARLRKH